MGQKRAALVGTAQTWVQAPWNDPNIVICGLNDLYNCGIPRADRWYDLHPISQMYFREATGKFVDPREIPSGKHYIRPAQHLQWLQQQAQQIPVFLQEVPDGWPPNAQRFPIEACKAMLRARPDQEAYIASSPALILAHLLLEGFTEIQIYGIHLATQAEYIKQRPGFEWLIGRAQERGVTIIFPEECPLLKHTHLYAYETEPKPAGLEEQKRIQQIAQEQQQLAQQLIHWPRWKSKAAAMRRMVELDALMADAQLQLKRAHLYAA